MTIRKIFTLAAAGILLFCSTAIESKANTLNNEQETDERTEHLFKDQTIICSDKKDLDFIKTLYPGNNYHYDPEQEYKSWTIRIISKKEFVFKNEKYEIVTWNEVKNPTYHSQISEWHYGGMALMKGNNIVDKAMTEAGCEIDRIILAKDFVAFCLIETFEHHGETTATLLVYKYYKGRIEQIEESLLHEGNAAASDTYEFDTKLEYMDLNNDKVVDIKITPVKIRNFSLSDGFRKVKKIIIK